MGRALIVWYESCREFSYIDVQLHDILLIGGPPRLLHKSRTLRYRPSSSYSFCLRDATQIAPSSKPTYTPPSSTISSLGPT